MKTYLAILDFILFVFTTTMGVFDYLFTKEPWRSKLLRHADNIESKIVAIKEKPITVTFIAFSQMLDKCLKGYLIVFLGVMFLDGALCKLFKTEFVLSRLFVSPPLCIFFGTVLLMSYSTEWIVEPKGILGKTVKNWQTLLLLLFPSVLYIIFHFSGSGMENQLHHSYLQFNILFNGSLLFGWYLAAVQLLWTVLIVLAQVITTGSMICIGLIPCVALLLYRSFLRFAFNFGDKLRWWTLMLVNVVFAAFMVYLFG